MGILDEAIREHLELKRAHGAPDAEVRRQEQEALGAARREPAAEGDAGPAPEAPEAVEAAPALDEAPAAEPAPDPEPAYEEPTQVVEPPPATEPPPPAPPTEEHEPELAPEPEAEPAPAEPGEEDVLEDTPDFLQETPEHDRLWFEQKPPRDFNFDE